MYVIPTTWKKDKISTAQSWPIGAEKVSAAFAEVPQLHARRLLFYGQFPSMRYRKKPIQVLSVSESAYEPGAGDIYVRPVPRILKHRVQRWLLQEGLPHIEKWLFAINKLENPHKVGIMRTYLDHATERIWLQHDPLYNLPPVVICQASLEKAPEPPSAEELAGADHTQPCQREQPLPAAFL